MSGTAIFELYGVDIMSARIARLGAKIPNDVGRALYQETEIEALEARRRTPVDTGALRSSIHVLGPEHYGRQIQTHIVAGGPAAPYAPIVHEDLEVLHPVGQAKFIESVLNEAIPFMAARVAKRIERNLGETI